MLFQLSHSDSQLFHGPAPRAAFSVQLDSLLVMSRRQLGEGSEGPGGPAVLLLAHVGFTSSVVAGLAYARVAKTHGTLCITTAHRLRAARHMPYTADNDSRYRGCLRQGPRAPRHGAQRLPGLLRPDAAASPRAAVSATPAALPRAPARRLTHLADRQMRGHVPSLALQPRLDTSGAASAAHCRRGS